mmetsp:Transcript_5377/g.15383  ORF Transcript_5377/g.15383 Transcript_5377/m.15383 type:complete len:276 (-) Transcript_5377:602-1429(-)
MQQNVTRLAVILVKEGHHTQLVIHVRICRHQRARVLEVLLCQLKRTRSHVLHPNEKPREVRAREEPTSSAVLSECLVAFVVLCKSVSVGDPRWRERVVQHQSLVEETPCVLVLLDHVIVAPSCEPGHRGGRIGIHKLVGRLENRILQVQHYQRGNVHWPCCKMKRVLVQNFLGSVIARFVIALRKVSGGLRCECLAIVHERGGQVWHRVLIVCESLAHSCLLQSPVSAFAPGFLTCLAFPPRLRVHWTVRVGRRNLRCVHVAEPLVLLVKFQTSE